MATLKTHTAGGLVPSADRTDDSVRKSGPPQAAPQLRDAPPPYPFGWYAVAFGWELRPGSVLTREFVDREIVVYRTKSGTVCAVEAYCPHLGTHLGYGGEVCGEEFRCPFHGFRFAVDGSCVHSPVGSPPRAARLGRLQLREIHEVILVWHGPAGQDPWEIETLNDTGWRRLHHTTRRVCSHPQELTENSVDTTHLMALHGFEDVRTSQPLSLDGPRLRTAYTFIQPVPMTSGYKVEIRLKIDGFGFSLTETDIAGWPVRLFGFVTPVGERDTIVHLAVTVRKRLGRFGIRALWSPIEKVIMRQLLRGMLNQFKQDEIIWDNKKYLHRPAIAPGDGEIHAYRKWSSQFYPEGNDS